jgi:hypothetical protein
MLTVRPYCVVAAIPYPACRSILLKSSKPFGLDRDFPEIHSLIGMYGPEIVLVGETGGDSLADPNTGSCFSLGSDSDVAGASSSSVGGT